MPCYAKAVAVAAYALNPIDLIPDFIPVFGYLDDVLIVPLGILLAVKLVPPELMTEFRAATSRTDRPSTLGRWGAALVVALWIVGVITVTFWCAASCTRLRDAVPKQGRHLRPVS